MGKKHRRLGDGAMAEHDSGGFDHNKASRLRFNRDKTQLFSNRQQQAFDFLEPRFGFLFGEAREFAAKRDEILVARDF